MSKNTILAIFGLIIIAVLIAGFLYFSQKKGSSSNVAEELNIKSADNPTAALPELNPIQKANPFGETYKNPFE